jgi:hypothetical protein
LPRSKEVDRAFRVFRIAGDGVDAVGGNAHLARGLSFPTRGDRPGNPSAWLGVLLSSGGEAGAVGSTGCCWGADFSATGAFAPCLHAVRLARAASRVRALISEIYLILIYIFLGSQTGKAFHGWRIHCLCCMRTIHRHNLTASEPTPGCSFG